MVKALELIKIPAGSEILKQGEIGTAFYIIHKGDVAVTREANFKYNSLANSGGGGKDHDGKSFLCKVEEKSRTASFFATIPSFRSEAPLIALRRESLDLEDVESVSGMYITILRFLYIIA